VSRILVVILTSSPAFISAQQTDSELANAHISPTLYFQSASDEAVSREALHACVSALVSRLANVDQKSLVHELDAANQALIDLQRHLAYLRVQTLENTQDHDARVAESSVETDRSVLDAAIENRLRKVPDTQINALGPFAFLATQAKQDAAHLLPPETEQYRERVTETCESDLSDVYGRLIDNMERPKDVYSPDLLKRQAAIKERNAAYDQVAPVAANLLAEIIDLQNRDAVAQGYANAADRKYDSLELSPQFIQTTLTEMQAQAPLHRRYEQVLAEHAMRKLKLSSVTSAEISLADPAVPRLSFGQARTGPHYLFEGFAMFNELLVLDHAAKVANTPAEREYASESFL
jgi:oligoendopeptidase F